MIDTESFPRTDSEPPRELSGEPQTSRHPSTHDRSPGDRVTAGDEGRLARHLDRLLELETMAAESYRQLLERVGSQLGAAQLRSIHADHVEAAGHLRRHVLRCGGKPSVGASSADADAWWDGSGAPDSTAELLAAPESLGVLRRGEERTIELYQRILEEDELSADFRSLVHGTLLPRQHHHVSTLRRWSEVQ